MNENNDQQVQYQETVEQKLGEMNEVLQNIQKWNKKAEVDMKCINQEIKLHI